MTTNTELLLIKQASLCLLSFSGYDIEDEKAIFGYNPEDMDAYFDHVMSDTKKNAIRKVLDENDLLRPRSSMSNIYESIERPGHYVVVFFAPIPPQGKDSVGKKFIEPAVSLCALYSYSKRKYCYSCAKKVRKTGRCQQCPAENYCADCIKSSQCSKCTSDVWCGSCLSKVKSWSGFKLTAKHCEACTPNDECKHCEEKMKCETCTPNKFCKDCTKIKELKQCENCPLQQFCRKCTVDKDLGYCEDCPPPPQIIERFIIITALPLSVEAGSLASANVPRIKASTGEWLDIGCVMQVFMDNKILYNPLINSMGSLYQVLTTDEAIDLFNNKNNTVTEHQIHPIDSNEPICYYLGLFPGKVLRIERKQVVAGDMAGRGITYRVVKAIPNAKKSRSRGLKKKGEVVISGVIEEE